MNLSVRIGDREYPEATNVQRGEIVNILYSRKATAGEVNVLT